MTELERLQKAVVDTNAAYYVAGGALDAAYYVAGGVGWADAEAAYYVADAALDAAEDAKARARLKLEDYLKEQANAT